MNGERCVENQYLTILAHMHAQQLTTAHLYSVSQCDHKTVRHILH